MNLAIEPSIHVVYDLRKSYWLVQAVEGMSFDVKYDKIFGFLGQNGAGKTLLLTYRLLNDI